MSCQISIYALWWIAKGEICIWQCYHFFVPHESAFYPYTVHPCYLLYLQTVVYFLPSHCLHLQHHCYIFLKYVALFLKIYANSIQLICMVFYWRWVTLREVWKNVENLKQSLSTLLPTDKVQAQPFLGISLHPLEDPPKSIRTTYVSPKVRCDQSKGKSGKRNTFLKLAPSPISLEMIVKSDKTGGDIFTMGTGRTWQMARYESLLVRDCVWVLTDSMTECVVRNSQLEQSAWGNCTVFCLLKESICLFVLFLVFLLACFYAHLNQITDIK